MRSDSEPDAQHGRTTDSARSSVEVRPAVDEGRAGNGLTGLAILLLCQSAGEFIARIVPLPLPGPVVGLMLLLGLLNVRWVRVHAREAAGLLLTHLSLLFIPVGVGVMSHLDLLERYGLRLLVILVLSTWIGLAVTALVLRTLWRPATDRAP